MKAVKILGRIVLGILGLAVLLYLILLAVNWKDQPPSADVHKVREVLAARPQLTATDNGVVYVLGFTAPRDQDPREVGARRLAWLETFTAKTSKESDPLENPIDLKSNGSPGVEPLKELCGEYDRKSCAESFEKAAIDWQPTETESRALQRYRALIIHRAWRDVVFKVTAPLPPFADVLHAQRLHQVSMLQHAAKGEVDAVRAGLEAEVVYWRGAQRNAETLIAKMIALAALRNHFFFSNLVLRRLPASQVMDALPPDWLREFSEDERSMHLVMAGEWKWVEESVGDELDGGLLSNMLEPTLVDRSLYYLGRPLFQPQDTLNIVADRNMRFSSRFTVPMNQYASAKESIETQFRDHPQPVSIYNPMGDVILSLTDGSMYTSYAFRTANPVGMRRAALLVAQMRSRRVTADAVESEVARDELRDPYTGASFEWDAKRTSVIFNAPEEGARARHEFFY
jgi:hypothetical protein